MENQQQRLSAANIRYLLVIRELDTAGSGACGTSIAQQLGVTKPSVFTMIGNLREMGLVEKERYGTVFLTEAGRRRAGQYASGYALIQQLFQSTLGVTGEDYRNAACEILAAIPECDLPLLPERLHRSKA